MIKMEPTLFHSEANEVSLKCRAGSVYIEKSYRRRLKSYAVDWPVERAAVEAFLLAFLRDRAKGQKIYVPKLYHFTEPDKIEMEYCAGTKLIEASPAQFCEIALWRQLFSFLYGLKEIRQEFLQDKLGDAFAGQQEIFACMKHWKFEDVINPPEDSYGCFSLGDVSLSNILVSERGFTLLDFECAHWGYAGYDIGQVLGMTEAYRSDPELKEILAQALEETVADPAYRECCLYWKKRFASYYRKKLRIAKEASDCERNFGLKKGKRKTALL